MFSRKNSKTFILLSTLLSSDSNKKNKLSLHKLSIFIFSFFCSWMLAFPYEGQIFYLLTDNYKLDPHKLVFISIFAQFIGLVISGFFIKTMKVAKRVISFSIIICMFASSFFFFDPSFLWGISIIVCSLLTGNCITAWGFLFKYGTPTHQRIKTAADSIILSNLIVIFLNSSAIYISPYVGLILSIVMLGIAGIFTCKVPTSEEKAVVIQPSVRSPKSYPSTTKPLALLCLFIVILTINSGLMYQVLKPAFSHHEWLVGWYWAIPYIIAIFILRNLSSKTNRTYLLFVALSMIGLSFIAFITFNRSVLNHLLVITLMLGACGIFDLFWWSILGEMLSLDKNPAKILGIGRSANVLGVLLGGILGNSINVSGASEYYIAMLALAVVCVSLILLPPLHQSLSTILENHVYLTISSELLATEQGLIINRFTLLGQLTDRENEVASLLLEGKTYKMIADELFISENTVKTHIKNIYSKCNIQNRAELIHLMLESKPDHKITK